jgi:POT family proton-dependent oligopeptide transporter
MPSRLEPWSISRRRSGVLVLLCAVQGCERFAFAAMLPLFVLYVQERQGMQAPTALMVLAIFQALSYLSGLPGGWLADRKLGVHTSTGLGAAVLTLAYGSLAVDHASLFWLALALMVVGHSLFRPGLHVLLARAMADGERARERGFLWHYLAANVGFALGALFGEWAHVAFGWGALFCGAAMASLLSAGLFLGTSLTQPIEPLESTATGAQPASEEGKGNMAAVLLLCSVAVVFWLTAQQPATSLAVFAAMNTRQQTVLFSRTMQLGPGHFAALHGSMVIAMLPVLLRLHGRRQTHHVSTGNLLIWGYVATAAGFALMTTASLHGGDTGRVSSAWLIGCYVLLSIAEILLAPLGMSLVTRLAPRDKAARAVGLWFASSAVGNGLAALLALGWERWPHHRYFAVLALVSLAAAAALYRRRPALG